MSKNIYKGHLGYRLFKEVEKDKFEIIQIVEEKEFNDKFVVEDRETKVRKTITAGKLKEYTPLEPKGVIVFIAVWMGTDPDTRTKDVIISIYDLFHIKMKDGAPYAVCRQGVNDFFYDTLKTDPDTQMVGVCTSMEECPAGIPYEQLQYCDGVIRSDFVYFYMDDMLDDILKCIDTIPYDNILYDNFSEALRSYNPFALPNLYEKKHFNGWCKDLRTLLIENSFITEFDAIRNIQALDCNVTDHIIPFEGYRALNTFDKEMNIFLSITYKLPILKTLVLKFDYDINMGDFQNENYIFIRGTEGILYLVVYQIEGQYLEAELQEKANELSISDKIRLAFYNKYQGLAGESVEDVKS